jgi:hypothetical protein
MMMLAVVVDLNDNEKFPIAGNWFLAWPRPGCHRLAQGAGGTGFDFHFL